MPFFQTRDDPDPGLARRHGHAVDAALQPDQPQPHQRPGRRRILVHQHRQSAGQRRAPVSSAPPCSPSIPLGAQDIRVTWTGGTVAPNARDYGIRLQYRVGDSGAFMDVPTPAATRWNTCATPAAATPQVIGPVTLPAAAENQPLVELRWKYYFRSGTSGAAPQLRVDDIQVTAGLRLQPSRSSILRPPLGRASRPRARADHRGGACLQWRVGSRFHRPGATLGRPAWPCRSAAPPPARRQGSVACSMISSSRNGAPHAQRQRGRAAARRPARSPTRVSR